MGRISKRILVGSGVAVALFLATIFLFGSQNSISVPLIASIFNATEEMPTLLVSDNNLTKALGGKLIENIGENAPTVGINPEKIVEATLKEKINDFNPDDLWPVIDEDKLPIIKNVMPGDDTAYLVSMNAIFLELGKSAINTKNPEMNDFAALAGAREKAFTALFATPVPPALLDIHLQLLDLLGAQKNIYFLIANYKNDPLKAMLALEFQKELFLDGIAAENDIKDYMAQNKILNGI